METNEEKRQTPEIKNSKDDPEETLTKLMQRPTDHKGRIMAMGPKPGFVFNPLRKLPVNMPCPCMSGKKFKKCHLDLLPLVVPKKLAESYKYHMQAPNLKFVDGEKENAKAKPVETQEVPEKDLPG